MNYDENLTYKWLRSLKKNILKEEVATNQCQQPYPLAASAVSPKWASLWGDFCYKDNGDGTIEINPEWVQNNIVDINLGGRAIKVNKAIATILPKAYEEAVKASGYAPTIGGRIGPWQPRHVQLGGTKPGISGHAWGMAIDFDPEANDPQGNKEAIIKSHPEFINKMKENGFAWLAEDDPMHFYYDINTAKNQQLFTSSDVASDLDSAGSGDLQYYSDWRPSFRAAIDSTIGKTIQNIFKENLEHFQYKDKFNISDESNGEDISKNHDLLLNMLSYYYKKLKFEKPVHITFKDDYVNARKVLGKTAYYNPDKMSIIIFTTNRSLKDILRSLGHELIHHKQHCNNEFEEIHTEEGYAQKDKKLRRKEKEAYLFGNMIFRDWEDIYKSKHKEGK